MNRLKKVICISLILGMLTLPSGCDENKTNSSSEFNPETDMQYFYHSGIANTPATKSETGYYYVGDDGIIIYVDKESMSATPLCFEPNCMHDDPEVCNAYFNISENLKPDSAIGTVSTAIQYYEGSLYMVCGEYDQSHIEYNTYLIRCDEDGSNCEQITDYFDMNFFQWFIHRGYLYYINDQSILRVPLDSPKSAPEAVFTLENYKENGYDSFQHLWAYGDYMYFYAQEYEDDTPSGTYQVCLNLKTLENKKVII